MGTVMLKGTPYVIVDICLQMQKPSEPYKADGFPADYFISHGADGKPFTKTGAHVRQWHWPAADGSAGTGQ